MRAPRPPWASCTGLEEGTVRYVIESIHVISADTRLVVLEQTYLDRQGEPRDARASHIHTYLVIDGQEGSRIAAGENTVRVQPDAAGREGGTR